MNSEHHFLVRIHLDTDFAGGTDDAAALAMLLGWRDAELVGITTTADPDGSRAGYVHYVLALAGRDHVPVAAGAATSLTTGELMGKLPHHETYWGQAAVMPTPSPQGACLELLAASIDRGAKMVAMAPTPTSPRSRRPDPERSMPRMLWRWAAGFGRRGRGSRLGDRIETGTFSATPERP